MLKAGSRINSPEVVAPYFGAVSPTLRMSILQGSDREVWWTVQRRAGTRVLLVCGWASSGIPIINPLSCRVDMLQASVAQWPEPRTLNA